MTFLEILRHPVTNLPIDQPKGSSFKETIIRRINDFGEMIDDSKDLSADVDGMSFTDTIFKKRNKELREGIIKTIETYYTGDLHGAYNCLSEFMKKSNANGYLNKEAFANINTNFYRIRKHDGNFPLTTNDLFHIPFNLRGKVRTQRYSIPGLPSLYIANSIYTAWEEMSRPDFSELQAIRLCNTRQLQLLDLRTDIYNRNEHLTSNTDYNWSLLYAVMIWPLIAACSVKVKNTNDAFKPEYILPQLLLQWVNKSYVDGILYSSTHIDFSKHKHDGLFYNIVVPVKSFQLEKGYCDHLSDLFQGTQVLPMQLLQFSSHAGRIYNQETINANVNKDIREIELIEGNRQPYHTTYFGILEHALNFLELHRFN